MCRCSDTESNGYPLWLIHALHRVPCFIHPQEQVKQSQGATEESSVLSELQSLKDQLETSEKERKLLESQLSEANDTVAQLQGEGSD